MWLSERMSGYSAMKNWSWICKELDNVKGLIIKNFLWYFERRIFVILRIFLRDLKKMFFYETSAPLLSPLHCTRKKSTFIQKFHSCTFQLFCKFILSTLQHKSCSGYYTNCCCSFILLSSAHKLTFLYSFFILCVHIGNNFLFVIYYKFFFVSKKHEKMDYLTFFWLFSLVLWEDS